MESKGFFWMGLLFSTSTLVKVVLLYLIPGLPWWLALSALFSAGMAALCWRWSYLHASSDRELAAMHTRLEEAWKSAEQEADNVDT